MDIKNVNRVDTLFCNFCKKPIDKPYMCQFCQKSAHYDCLKYYILDYENCPICQTKADITNIIPNRVIGEVIMISEIKTEPDHTPIEINALTIKHPEPQKPKKIETVIPQKEPIKEEKKETEILPVRPPQTDHSNMGHHQKSNQPSIVQENKCKTHPEFELEFYCNTSNVLICKKCVETSIEHKGHLTHNIRDLPDVQIDLNELSQNITKSIITLQTNMDSITTSSKYSGKILPFCMELDVAINGVKKRLKAKKEEKEKKIEKKYSDLINQITKLSTEIDSFNYCEKNLKESSESFNTKIKSEFDSIDAKRCFNFEKTISIDFNINEFIPPERTASFAFILPDKNVIFQRNINIYYCDWTVSLLKNDKSDYYTLTLNIKEGETLPKDFSCMVSFHIINNEYIDVKKEIEYNGNIEQFCYLYFFEYASHLVGKLFTLTISFQPKTYKAITSLHQIELLEAAQLVPSDAKGMKKPIKLTQKVAI